MGNTVMKMFLPIVILVLIWRAVLVNGTIEEVEVTPSNTNGIELGDLSFMQLVLFAYIFLTFAVLYTVGVLPLEVNLGAIFDNNANGRGLINREAELSTYLFDCPLQFVCDVDAWAYKDHEYFVEKMIASWFRNPNATWHGKNGAIYGGMGTCKEMYPCPFNVQDVIGIRIPGSNEITHEDDSYLDNIYSFH